ncbi:MAG: PIG-L family deacetylase [Acidobacteria bacterium]|nr:PIG-L family deacetylase [Acidobacteriota bacterium]
MRCYFLLWMTAAAVAQEPLQEDLGSAGLAQTLRKLAVNVRVLHIAAHPDDEDSATLTWLARGQGAHLVLLSLNRGEAGANLVSSDFFDRLGALRTVEFLRACQYYGAGGLRFTRFVDYGYSKNVAETFRNWNRDAVLADVVRVIREEQPHIVISRWGGTPRDGHGNHEAAGILAREAFEAAGDPMRFPSQMAAGLKPWQPLKLYLNHRREDEYTVRIDSGAYDPWLGKSYAQMGRLGYRQHRSQGAGPSIPQPGPVYGYYLLAGSKAGPAQKETHLFERLDTSLGKWPPLASLITEAQGRFQANKPSELLPILAKALAQVRAGGRSKDLEIKEAQLLLALEQAAGISFQALADPDQPVTGPAANFRAWESFLYATPGQRFTVTASFHSPNLPMERIELLVPAGWSVKQLDAGRFEIQLPGDAAPTAAYWRRPSVREARYNISEDQWFGRPLPPCPVRARAIYRVGGVEASVERDVQVSYLDQLGIQLRRSLAVAPAVSLRFFTEAGYLPLRGGAYRLTVAVRNHFHGPANGVVRVEAPPGWQVRPASATVALAKESEESAQPFDVSAPAGVKEGVYEVRAIAHVNGRDWSSSFLPVTEAGLASVYLSQPSTHQVRVLDVALVRGLRTAYIPGTGDDVPEAMRQLGLASDILDTDTLATGDLSRYHTILLGIRAYAARKDVRTFNSRLLEYVNNGGVLVVQYNTQEYDNNYGPYPYSMTMRAEEVSEEDAPVRFLAPDDAVFHFPNRITEEDFDGWVEQRGSKFFTTWDAGWKPLIETHDAGQAPQRGAWLAARHGKGLYVYCALAWYRQLPFAVPGAARIFANLVSLGAPDAPWRK